MASERRWRDGETEMEIGEAMSCRCPKCGSRYLLIEEEFTVVDVSIVNDGKFGGREAGLFPSATGRAHGQCGEQKCRHKWPFRKSPFA